MLLNVKENPVYANPTMDQAGGGTPVVQQVPVVKAPIVKDGTIGRRPDTLDRRLSVAPMMDWTDRHQRMLLRLLTKNTLLYTEMVVSGAILHGDVPRFLDFSPQEHPLALQIGGSDPDELAKCVKIATSWGYDEFNLNVGCPSDRVQSGRFGACLMADPALVRDGVHAMRQETDRPVTVKHRLGIDDLDTIDHLRHFIETVAEGGCRVFIIHARKAWLQGLSPKQNRDIPPLQYDRVYRMKAEYPDLTFVLNGGVPSLEDCQTHWDQGVDGCMIGRAAYQRPWILAGADRVLAGEGAPVPRSKSAVLHALTPYLAEQLAQGVPLHCMTRHMYGLLHGEPNARLWRRHLSEYAPKPGAGIEVWQRSLELLPPP